MALKIRQAHQYDGPMEVGQRVFAPYRDSKEMYLGTVTAVAETTCTVLFDDKIRIDTNVSLFNVQKTWHPFVDAFTYNPDVNPDYDAIYCYNCNILLENKDPTLVCNYCRKIVHRECLIVYYISTGSRMCCHRCKFAYTHNMVPGI